MSKTFTCCGAYYKEGYVHECRDKLNGIERRICSK